MKLKPEKFLSCVFICVIVLLMCSVCYEIIASEIETNGEDFDEIEIIIDWEKLYPFDSDFARTTQITQEEEGALRRGYNFIKEELYNYTSKKIADYIHIVESARKYEDLIKWNIAYIYDYNPIVKLSDGYLTSFISSFDVTKDARSILGLANFCESLDIKFLYINLPNKVCVSQDKDIAGILDYCNQNTDKFLSALKDSGVEFYDLRKILHDQGMNHHESFFVTDHHMKPETGLWAAREILKILRDNYNWPVNPDILNPENFDKVIYRDWFLGSQGKKSTLSRTKPDDISLFYPKFNTSFHYEVPNLEINTSGDFAITYDMSQIQSRDYYELNSYAAYDYADRPLIKLTNLLTEHDKKLLIIHESFENCIVPFIALDVKNVFEIDLRFFTGSLKNFIKSECPDIVIVSYNAAVPGRASDLNASDAAKKMFDFR